MEARCGTCNTKHTIDDKQLAGYERIQFRCAKCGAMTLVDLKRRPERTKSTTPLPSFARGSNAAVVTAEILKEPPGLSLPKDKDLTLTVIGGLSKGESHVLKKPRVVMGRSGGGAEFEVDDAEVSRWHCAIEVKDGMVWLKDLESTNGTYFEEERTRAAVLPDGAQFRIGSTFIELKITPKT
jgi:predicted Zn finger-like uncharacterized protein